MRRRSRGVTLIELLLSLSVLAIVGALTVTMMVSMSRGTAHGREVRSRNLRLEVLCARVDARVRSSVRVLAVDDNFTNLEILESVLASWNFDYETAPDGPMALVKLQLRRLGKGRQPNPGSSPVLALIRQQIITKRRTRLYRAWVSQARAAAPAA